MFKLSSSPALALSLALLGGLGLAASSSAFSATDLSQGYTLASADQTKPIEGRCGEGKCGEGKCGAAIEP